MKRVLIAVGAMLVLCSCSRDHSPDIDRVAKDWAQQCILKGPQKNNAEALAATYSLSPVSDDIAANLRNEYALINKARSGATPLAIEIQGWWLDESSSTILTVARLQISGSTSEATVCQIEGNSSASDVSAMLSAIDLAGINFSLSGAQDKEYTADGTVGSTRFTVHIYSSDWYKDRESSLRDGTYLEAPSTSVLSNVSLSMVGTFMRTHLADSVHYVLLASPSLPAANPISNRPNFQPGVPSLPTPH